MTEIPVWAAICITVLVAILFVLELVFKLQKMSIQIEYLQKRSEITERMIENLSKYTFELHKYPLRYKSQNDDGTEFKVSSQIELD